MLKTPGIAKMEIWIFFEFFCIAHFSKKERRIFPKQKEVKNKSFDRRSKPFFSKNDNAKDDERQCWTFFKNQKKNFRGRVLGILEENVFCSEKWSIFSKEQD